MIHKPSPNISEQLPESSPSASDSSEPDRSNWIEGMQAMLTQLPAPARDLFDDRDAVGLNPRSFPFPFPESSDSDSPWEMTSPAGNHTRYIRPRKGVSRQTVRRVLHQCGET